MRPTMGILAAALVLGFAAPSLADASRLALVVGSNKALDPELEPLRYADDDALRTASLLRLVSDDVRVLVRPDEETEALLAKSGWAAPSREAVLAALDAQRQIGHGHKAVVDLAQRLGLDSRLVCCHTSSSMPV